MAFGYTVTLIDSANHSYGAALVANTRAAAATWASNIYGKGTIDIQVTISNNTTIGTANGGPATSVYLGRSGQNNIFRGGAESELITGIDPNGSGPDILITIDPAFIDRSLFIDPDPSNPSPLPRDKTSLKQVMEHEIGHGLGMVGFRDTTTGNLNGAASPWDNLVQIGSDGTAKFGGTSAQTVLGGQVNVTTERNGNSAQFYHLGASASDYLGSDLMAGYGTPLGQLRTVSNVDLAILKDLGLSTFGSAGGNTLVDALFYKGIDPDVARAHVDPVVHYNQFGWHEGRDPNALFSTIGYLAANTDVKAAGLNPLTHYDLYGWKEGRDPSFAFDNELYLARNADVRAAGIDPLAHYLSNGQFEGRQAFTAIGKAKDIEANGGFDAEYYLLANPDVARAVLSAGADGFSFALDHYNRLGFKEGRDANAHFDSDGYLAAYADVRAAGFNPLAHYHQYGWKEGRDPSANFDTDAYLINYRDVAAAGIDPLQHYLQHGALEGRSTFADGLIG